jgi:hypothetical protein
MSGNINFNGWLNDDGSENYKCRAWVNFNGQGTVAIRTAGNISSITDHGTGDYTATFTTPMPDANYCITCMGQSGNSDGNRGASGAQLRSDANANPPTVSDFRFFTAYGSTASSDGNKEDQLYVMLSIFR